MSVKYQVGIKMIFKKMVTKNIVLTLAEIVVTVHMLNLESNRNISMMSVKESVRIQILLFDFEFLY